MDCVQPAWKIISLLLSLGVFLGIGVMSLSSGDEFVWSIGKATGAFIASWIVLSYLGSFLGMIVEKPEDFPAAPSDGEIESGERG